MSMADGSPIPEELDDILAIPMCDYHSYHPGASFSFVVTLGAAEEQTGDAEETQAVPATTEEDDLPTEDVDLLAQQSQPPSPQPQLQLQLQSEDIDPIELPAHLLIP